MSQDLIAKNYGFSQTEKQSNDLLSVSENRAMHEVQASFVIAKKFPRNESEAFSKIMKASKRPFLAEQAIYAYPKGGKVVKGASIRMAEVLISAWGNCDFGVEEISQSNGVSIAKAYAIDKETNTRSEKIFHVPHHIGTKSGIKKLTDPRDIYELVANQGARRMRACILAIIPGDITDAALDECEKTMSNGVEPITDRIRKLVMAFDELGVKVEHLEKRLGHNLDATIETELATLRGIYKSLKDGMAKRDDFFDMGSESIANKSIDKIIETKKNASPVATSNENEYDVKEYSSKSVAQETLNEIKDKLK